MPRLFPLLFLFLYGALNCGFLAGTLIQTPSSYVPIEHISIGAILCCQSGQRAEVLGTHSKILNDPVILVLGDGSIVASPDQKFYLAQQREWRAAKDLKSGDVLLNAGEEHVVILDVVPTDDAVQLFELSLEEPHTFYVTNQNILTHNCAPIVLGIAETIPVAVTAAKVGLAGLVSWFAKQVQKSNGRRSLGGSAAPQPRPPIEPEDEKSEEWKREHPNGKYRDAAYHHKNCQGPKSKAPKNGQQALDNSYFVKEKGNAKYQRRIGVSEGELVVLQQDSVQGGINTFHGHVEEWKSLASEMREILINEGIVSSSGKIL